MWVFELSDLITDEMVENLYLYYKAYRQEKMSPMLSFQMAWERMRRLSLV